MNLRAHTLVGLLVLALAASGCSAETSATTSEQNEFVAHSTSSASLKTQLASAVKGLTYTSETDAEFDVFVAPGAPGAAITPADIRTAFSGLEHTTDDYDGTLLKDLKGAATLEFEAWMASDLDIPNDESAEMLAYKKGLSRARDLMKANLTNLTVVYLASDPKL